MSANPPLCRQVGPVNPTLWLCQARPRAHVDRPCRASAVGLSGVPLYRQNNVYSAKYYGQDMDQTNTGPQNETHEHSDLKNVI